MYVKKSSLESTKHEYLDVCSENTAWYLGISDTIAAMFVV